MAGEAADHVGTCGTPPILSAALRSKVPPVRSRRYLPRILQPPSRVLPSTSCFEGADIRALSTSWGDFAKGRKNGATIRRTAQYKRPD